jgi:diguanylate cyclase (GGDEF)-like protein/PAS domain S-box-containing protein
MHRLWIALALTPVLVLISQVLWAGVSFNSWELRALSISALIASAIGAALVYAVGLRPIRKAFAREEQKISALFNAIPEGVLEVDENGTILFVNVQVCSLFGYQREELLGASIEMLIPPQFRAGHVSKRADFIARSGSRAMGSGMNINGIRKDGTEIAVDISLSRLETPRGVSTYCLVRDNSARKAFELQLLENNNKLLAGVATLERNALELRQMTEMGDLLHSSTTEKELFQIAAHTVSRLFPTVSGALYTLKESRSMAEVSSCWGPAATVLRPVISFDDCWALRRGRPHSTTLITDEPRCRHHVDSDKRPCQCIPLLGHGDLLGVLHLYAGDFSESCEIAAPSRVQFIQALANQVALSTANLRLRETLRTQSLVDPLTGLYNRRMMDTWLDREIRNAHQTKRPLSVLIMDIDHFKAFNDRCGHQCGDIALKELSAVLKRSLRHEDLICRLGGEEFIALLPDTSLLDAEKTAEKLRLAAEALQIRHSGRILGQLTISIGVSGLGAQGDSAASLIRRADRALYRAKAGGRNRVAVANEAEEPEILPVLATAPRRA